MYDNPTLVANSPSQPGRITRSFNECVNFAQDLKDNLRSLESALMPVLSDDEPSPMAKQVADGPVSTAIADQFDFICRDIRAASEMICRIRNRIEL